MGQCVNKNFQSCTYFCRYSLSNAVYLSLNASCTHQKENLYYLFWRWPALSDAQWLCSVDSACDQQQSRLSQDEPVSGRQSRLSGQIALKFFCSHFSLVFLFQCPKSGSRKEKKQRCGPWHFGKDPDPYLWLMDPTQDPASDPAIFVSDFKMATKKIF